MDTVRIYARDDTGGRAPSAVMALRDRGRLKVIVAIEPDISTEIVLVMAAARVLSYPLVAPDGVRLKPVIDA